MSVVTKHGTRALSQTRDNTRKIRSREPWRICRRLSFSETFVLGSCVLSDRPPVTYHLERGWIIIIILSCLSSLDSSKPIQMRISANHEGHSTHILRHLQLTAGFEVFHRRLNHLQLTAGFEVFHRRLNHLQLTAGFEVFHQRRNIFSWEQGLKFFNQRRNHNQLAAGFEVFPSATQHSPLFGPVSHFARLRKEQLIHQSWIVEQCWRCRYR